MSERYLCDRCGSTHGGSPDTMLLLGDGRPRKRRSVAGGFTRNDREGEMIGDVEFDLCLACRNDLRAWWRDGGGEPGEIARDAKTTMDDDNE